MSNIYISFIILFSWISLSILGNKLSKMSRFRCERSLIPSQMGMMIFSHCQYQECTMPQVMSKSQLASVWSWFVTAQFGLWQWRGVLICGSAVNYYPNFDHLCLNLLCSYGLLIRRKQNTKLKAKFLIYDWFPGWEQSQRMIRIFPKL